MLTSRALSTLFFKWQRLIPEQFFSLWDQQNRAIRLAVLSTASSPCLVNPSQMYQSLQVDIAVFRQYLRMITNCLLSVWHVSDALLSQVIAESPNGSVVFINA